MTPKQQRFIEEYLIDFNATQAAIRAGYSKKTAGKIGHENLQKHEIKSQIESEKKRLAKQAEIEAINVIKELNRIGFSDIRNVMGWYSKKVIVNQVNHNHTVLELKDAKDIPDSIASCIKEIGHTANGIKIVLYDKQKALELLGRYLGMWVDKTEHSGPGGSPIPISPVDPKLIISEAVKLIEKAKETNETFE